MNDLSFAYLGRIHWIWAAVALVVLLGVLELRGRDRLTRFLSQVMQTRLASRHTVGRHVTRLGMVLGMFVLAILALMRPQTPGDAEFVPTHRTSADVVFVLDVSRSMLAEDTAPNRLTRAKSEISQLVEALPGDRVGVVAFAGRAQVQCPLTFNTGFFRTVLREIDTDTVSRGGTRIGDGLSVAIDAFPVGDQPKLIVLVTDGEDHDSYPREAAERAAQLGIRIVSIGFGDEAGSEIALTDPETGARSVLLDRGGNIVRSRLDGDLLREIALATEGAYIPAGVAALDLSSIVEIHFDSLTWETTTESMTEVEPNEHYTWPVMGSLLCLIGAVWVGASGQRRGLSV